MRIVILGNGEWLQPRNFLRLLRPSDFVIACDGAYDKARRLGIRVHAVIGDLDSIRSIPTGSKVKVLAFPADKDETDAELAMRYALDKKPREIVWYAPWGGRWDHTLGNIFLLSQAARKKIPVQIVQGSWRIFLALTSCVLRGRKGDRVSLLPFSKAVHGIRTTGLRYALHGGTLVQERTRGISNGMTSKAARVKIKRGWLLVLHEESG